MAELQEVAPAFVAMAHEIVWCNVATVDAEGRPRSRVLHPIWEYADGELTGWVGTGPTPTKRAHISASPYVSCNYWSPSQDTCVAECHAEWAFEDATCERIWSMYTSTPPPLGYDPAIIPGWENAHSESFAVLKMTPWRLRVMPGSVLMSGTGDTLVWRRR
jgi:hypothetical protein